MVKTRVLNIRLFIVGLVRSGLIKVFKWRFV